MKNKWDKKLKFFVSCAKNIVGLLKEELESLGIKELRQAALGVEFNGNLDNAYTVCLWSRLANRVILQLADFNAEDALALYEGTNSIDWQDHFRVEDTFMVDFIGVSAAINNSHFGALKVKDAIMDKFMKVKGNKPRVNKDSPNFRVSAYLCDDIITIGIDLSGDSLHRRGYRKVPRTASIKETLAAAILYRSGWSNLCGQMPLIDPMCGSGTILIEAAMIACDCAPGLFRKHFGFNSWLHHDPSLWSNLLKEAKERNLEGRQRLKHKIYGSDLRKQEVDAAREIIEITEFDKIISTKTHDARNISPESFGLNCSGIIVTNSPYGKRLKDIRNLGNFYANFGECLRKNFIDWKVAVFSGNLASSKRLQMRPDNQYRFFNGTIPCRLLIFKIREEIFWRECSSSKIVINHHT